MNVDITIDGLERTFTFYNFQYWNQRFFCLGVDKTTGEVRKFISTKGFDRILVQCNTGAKFNFRKMHFNPYLCSREKDIWRESQIIDKKRDQFACMDVGPTEWGGRYRTCKVFDDYYRDDIYFETRPFELGDFDLMKYQSDDLYFIQHQSKNHDQLPIIINMFDNDKIFGNIGIIHAVTDDGKEYFDEESLNQICNADLGYTETNGLYCIIQYTPKMFLHHLKIGQAHFLKIEEIMQYKRDCGNAYIKKNVLKKLNPKLHAFRYMYEYYNNVHKMTSKRRQQSMVITHGPKEFKKEDFVPIFEDANMLSFKIIYFKNLFTSERKTTFTSLVPGDPIFQVEGYYNSDGTITYYDFPTLSTLLDYISQYFGVTQRMRFSQLISIWFKPNFGYTPRITEILLAESANKKSIVKSIRIISVPILESLDTFSYMDTFINFFQLLGAFGLHIPKVRNILEMDNFDQSLFSAIEFSCDIYHISRDARRPLFKLENNDKPLSETMIRISDAFKLIQIFEKIGEKKNSFWYRNANKLIQSFPDLMKKNSSLGYQVPSLLTYIEGEHDEL